MPPETSGICWMWGPCLAAPCSWAHTCCECSRACYLHCSLAVCRSAAHGAPLAVGWASCCWSHVRWQARAGYGSHVPWSHVACTHINALTLLLARGPAGTAGAGMRMGSSGMGTQRTVPRPSLCAPCGMWSPLAWAMTTHAPSPGSGRATAGGCAGACNELLAARAHASGSQCRGICIWPPAIRGLEAAGDQFHNIPVMCAPTGGYHGIAVINGSDQWHRSDQWQGTLVISTLACQSSSQQQAPPCEKCTGIAA